MILDRVRQVRALEERWAVDERWRGIRRSYAAADVVRMRGSVHIEHSLAWRGADRLRSLLAQEGGLTTLYRAQRADAAALVRAGAQALHVSTAAAYGVQARVIDNRLPLLVRAVNDELLRADRADWSQGKDERDWLVPIVAHAGGACSGPKGPFDLVRKLIEAGAAGVQLDDLLPGTEESGAPDGVLVPTSSFMARLNAVRFATDVLDVPWLLIARTAAQSATLLMSDRDARDRFFLTGYLNSQGYWDFAAGIGAALARALAYAPYADVLWLETEQPDLDAARRFAAVIHTYYPGKWLAYGCVASEACDAVMTPDFEQSLAALGYRIQAVPAGMPESRPTTPSEGKSSSVARFVA